MSFGERLRQERLRRLLTQEELAEALSISPRTISRWEQNLAVPRSFARQQLSQFFALAPEELFQDFEESVVPDLLWAVPLPRNPFFTGRDEILHALHMRFTMEQSSMPALPLALSGLGGIGKTQIAIEYAYRYSQAYQAIFWLAAETSESLMTSLLHIADQLQLPERQNAKQAQVQMAVQRWLANHSGWLLIVDNVEDLDVLHRLLPPRRSGTLLLTTRLQAPGPLAESLEVPAMSNKEGMTFLLRRTRQLRISSPLGHESMSETGPGSLAVEAEASRLVSLLEGLPLALDQAGAYIEETGCSITHYLERYTGQRKYLLARRGLSGGTHPDSVTATLELALQQIAQTQPGATELLQACAFLHPDSIPEELFSKGATYLGPVLSETVADPVQFDLILAALRSASLIMRSPGTRTLSVHRLVQAVLQDQMDSQEYQRWSERIICMVNAVFPSGEAATWVECERYLAQVMACGSLVPFLEQHLLEASNVFFRAGFYLVGRGRLPEAEALLEQSTALAERHYGTDHPELLRFLQKKRELVSKQENV